MFFESPPRSAVPEIFFPAIYPQATATVMSLFGQLMVSQWWSRARMQAMQFEQLSRLVRHAAKNVPFHAMRLRQAGIDPTQPIDPEAYRRLPVLTRQDVQKHGERLHARRLPEVFGSTSHVASGGSTGMPVRVIKSALDRAIWEAMLLREDAWHFDGHRGDCCNIGPTSTQFDTVQARTPQGSVRPDWGAPIGVLFETGKFYNMDSALPLASQMAFLCQHDPEYLHTMPSVLNLLLHYAEETGMRPQRLRKVWLKSEMITTALRRRCEAVFGASIVANYSSAETGYVALQCTKGDGYHVSDETQLVEILDTDGRPVQEGEVGRVVVTPLHNFAMPLLRYEIGDWAELGGSCSCGRCLTVLNNIVGRIPDDVVYPDGSRRRHSFHHYGLSEVRAVQEFQLVQATLERIELHVVASRALTVAERETLMTLLKGAFSAEFEFEVIQIDRIERTAAGKLRSFVSRVT